MDKANKISIVGVEWIDQCINEGKKVDEADYHLIKSRSDEQEDQDEDIEMADSQATSGTLRRSARSRTMASPMPHTEAMPVPEKKRSRTATKQDTLQEEPVAEGEVEKNDGSNDADSEMKDTDPADADDERRPVKRARGRKAIVASGVQAAPTVTSAPAQAPPAAKKGRKTTKTSDTVSTPNAPADSVAETKIPANKTRGKRKVPTPAVVNESEKEDEEPPVVLKTVKMAKGTAPVDEYFPDPTGWSVYVDPNGVIYDGCLNQTDIGKNSNKFYYVQLLEKKPAGGFATWTRWGRVGEKGQTSMVAQKGSTLSWAMSQFEKKFKDKSGLYWSNRSDTPRASKYTYVLKNYTATDDESSDGEDSRKGKGKGKGKATSKQDEELPIPESKLHKCIQNLMALIFNSSIMQQQMLAMSYDANKLPLGKLSKSTINQGFLALKAIGELINDVSLAQSQYGTSLQAAFIQLTNRYYSVIPHAFGRSTPPVISTPQMLKREVELIESLGDMKIATEVLKDSTKVMLDKDGNRVNPIDKQFETLSLEEATPLDKSSSEYQCLEGYLKRTHGKTHYIKLQIEDIFRIERRGEAQRFVDAGLDKLPNDNRYLLWHGSRVTNFAGILSQGLRIAPPEAPVNGYMFGKGIYLADMVTKSANYCSAYESQNTGLLMLCEAQLGDPMYELKSADYNAAQNSQKAGALATKGKGMTAPPKWMDAEAVHENLKGVKMPDVNTDPANVTESGLYLQYNEVYSFPQFALRKIPTNVNDFCSILCIMWTKL